MLFLSYVIGLLFTLRTHAAVIWNTEIEEKQVQQSTGPNGSLAFPNPPHIKQQSASSGGGSASRTAIKDSQMYKRILGQSLKQVGLEPSNAEEPQRSSISSAPRDAMSPHMPPHLVPPKSAGAENASNDSPSIKALHIEGLSEEQNTNLVRQVAELAATAATVAARDATRPLRHVRSITQHTQRAPSRAGTLREEADGAAAEVIAHGAGGGHDAPNWSRMKSTVILLGATLLYAIIAEILVNTVDVVLESVAIDEKFLGITLFALVPNTTEFLVNCLTSTQLIHANNPFTERYIFCDEWQHCFVDGDWFSLRFTGLSTANPGPCSLQRLA